MSYLYQWLRAGSAISGATASTYTTQNADIGHAITLNEAEKATYGSTVITSAYKASSNSASVSCSVTNSTAGAISPSGNGVINTPLSTTNGSWTTSCPGSFPSAPTWSYTYQWLRDGSATGMPATQSYTTASADIGHTDTARVTAKATWSFSGGSTSVTSSPKTSTGSFFVAPAPSNTAVPSISGTTKVGSQLTGSDGTWTTYGVPTTVNRQWQRCGYPSTVRSDSPLAYWRLGDTTGVTPTARDELERNDGTYSGSPTYAANGALNGDGNGAVNFNGNSYLDLSAPVSFGSTDFTIEGWFQTSSPAVDQQIWESDYTGEPSQPQDVSLALVNGKAQFQVEDQTMATALVASSSTYNDGAWHYITAVRSGNTFSLYVDGVSVGSASQTVGDVDVDGSIPRIGNGQSASLNSHDAHYFGGSLDEIAVYTTALSSTQIGNHDDAGLDITSSCVDIPGATDQTYTLTGDDFGNVIRYDVSESNDDGSSPTVYSNLTGVVSDNAPGTPSVPPVPSSFATLTPVLQANASDSDGDPLDFQFRLLQNGTAFFTSDWLPGADNWTVPAGVLTNKSSYTYEVRARDPYQDTAWSAVSNSFTITLPMLGSSSYWPMWSHGPVTVNEANGNLLLSLPTPSYPTAIGSLSFSLTYNSQSSSHSPGLGTGWTLAAGDAATSPPVQLIDHSQDSSDSYAAAEIEWPDGSTDDYNQVGSSDTYLPNTADGSQLTKNQDNSGWTLLASDGTTYLFDPAQAPSDGRIWPLTAAQSPAAASGHGVLSYSFDPLSELLTSVTFNQQTGDSGETLSFDWNCVGALFCVTGPDGKTWTYTATSGQITGVSDGSRQLLALTYDPTSGLPIEIQNANDLDPSHASPGYNSQHSLQLTYTTFQTQPAVSCLINGPLSGQAASQQPSCAGGGSASESTWSFDYADPCPSLRAPGPGHSVPQGTAAGCTTVTNPDQQPSGAGITVIYDSAGRPLEYDDARLGSGNERITLQQYDDQNQLAWSEDEDGNPTDYSYDPLNNTLLSVTEPRPASGQPRPVTSYRYDEQTIGSSSQAGNALTGLAGSYWTNANLVGQPVTRENDPTPDSSATSFSLPATGMSWPPGAVGTGGFSARWSGGINIPTGGDYTFTTSSDGSTRLTIDGADLIENWTSPSSPFTAQPVHLSQGPHTLVLEYAHTSGTANLELDWSCADCIPAISQTAVPLNDLTPAWENQTSVVSPAGRISFQHYADPASAQPDYSLVKLSDGTNLITSYHYDPLGRTDRKYMPKANAAGTINPTTGDLTSTPDTNYETDYTYYTDGETAAPPADCGGGTAVDQYGQLKSTTIPNGGLHSLDTVYNTAGSPIALTNGKGVSCLSYDNENRLTSQTPHGDQTNPTSYTYDPSGTQRTVSNNSGTVSNVYDEAGRLTDTTDASGAEESYVYDPDGNQTQRTAATGPLGSSTNYATSYGYDAADELTSETDPASNTYSLFYDERGNLRGTQYPNTTFSWIDTNPDGWIIDQYNRHGTISGTTSTPPADSSPLADFTYTYDADGKRQSQSRISGSNSQTTSYSYDQAGRLNQVILPDGTCRNYSYDLDSNRKKADDYAGGCNGTLTTTTNYTYDPTTTPGNDQLTSTTTGGNTTTFAYTSDGQVSSQGTTSYTWDGFGRLSTATVGNNTVSYSYDPASSLMTRTSSSPSTTTNYLLGDLFETNGNGTITASYTNGPAGNLASFNGPPSSSSTATFLYYDAHGNLTAEVTSGTQTGNHTYDPFGTPLDSVPANTTVHRYVGRWDKQYDTTTDDILMGARPYDPGTGRFLSVDPVSGGSLNTYDYAGQDPVDDYDLGGTVHCGSHCGGQEVGPWDDPCYGLNFYPHGSYVVYAASGKVWTVCTMHPHASFGVIGACLKEGFGGSAIQAFFQGFYKGRLEKDAALKLAAKLGLRDVPVAGLLGGCLTGVLRHYR